MTSTRRVATLLPCFALLLLAACGGDDAEPVAVADLDGRTFQATESEGHTIVDGSTITITFVADQLSVQTGCNTVAGGFTIDGDVINAPQLISTMMACEEPLMAQEAWISALLSAGPTVELDGEQLTLEKGDDSISFDEVK